MKEREQHGGLDLFKIIAAFLVVTIHTSPLASFDGSADFVLTRILARMAVPFFFMVTGYFVLPQYLFEHSRNLRPLLRSLKKVLILYAAAIVLYLPVNLYAGQLEGAGIGDVFRMLFFDGTFYHLWYLPALLLGALIVFTLSRKLPFHVIMGIALLLYCFGLCGDSYFGLLADKPFIKEIYAALFRVFSYTRNGIFYAPVFLAMGAWLAQAHKRRRKNGVNIVGFALSAALMAAEGLTLRRLGVQRHDSMYMMLLPCMFFLFQIILLWKVKPVKHLRTIATGIYLLHPLVIVFVRAAAKIMHLEELLIENSFLHFIAVSVISCIASVIYSLLYSAFYPVFYPIFRGKGVWRKRQEGSHRERAWIELCREKLDHNVGALSALLPPGCQLMPAVKANAYGHGDILVSRELNACGVKAFCVATASEGTKLRRNGIKGDILVMGYTHPEQFLLLQRYHLIQTVIDPSYAEVLNSYGNKIRVHIKIDTGMHRLGIRSEKIEEISKIFQYKNLQIEGLYTHLCADDTASPKDREFTAAQGKAFYEVIAQLEEAGCVCPKIHLQASYGLLNYPELSGDYARIGIALYGVLSSRTDWKEDNVRLLPVLSVKARVASVKELFQGEAAGYGLHYVADRNRKIAVLTIGYADGLPRSLSCGVGKVLINGGEAPVIGSICMDQTLVDVTAIPDVKQGDIAVIIGSCGTREITAYDVAEQSGTITNELLSRLGSRLDRIMI